MNGKARSGDRVGLLGMREHAPLAGGMLHIESQPGRGTTVLPDCLLANGELLH
jgi:signal transduction histidine kinase